MSYEMACTFLTETSAAVKIFDHVTDEIYWIPLSQVDAMHGKGSDGRGEGSIVMSDWIAQKKGFI